MKTKIVGKIYFKTLVLGLLLFILGSRPSVAAAMIDGGLTSQSTNDSAWEIFDLMKVTILAPLMVIWLLAYILRQILKKKGLDLSGSKELFQVFTVGFIFAILSYAILFIALTYLTSFEDSHYNTDVILVILISDLVMCLWIFLHCARYRSIMKKKSKLLINNIGNQNDANKNI